MTTATPAYRRIFETAAKRLEAEGISVCLEFGPAVAVAHLDQFEKAWGISIPPSLRQFYCDVGNGLTFKWFVDRSDPKKPFCWLVVPTLDDLQKDIEYLWMLNECLKEHTFWESEEPELAKQHYHRQLSFFPFLRDNADLICLGPRRGNDIVVFHDHEWSFHKCGDSGIRLTDSLMEFWQGWSTVGFIDPTQFWWPATVRDSKVEWSGNCFGFHLRQVT